MKPDGFPYDTPLLNPDTYFNRELSNLEFQKRVLALAHDRSLPLLERLKYIAIVGNNLDEFFMVRVASYFQKIAAGKSQARPDGLTPQQVLRQVRETTMSIIHEQRTALDVILRELDEQGVRIIGLDALNEQERQAVDHYFDEAIFPVLTPLAVDKARPFPFISNLSLNLGILLVYEEHAQSLNDDDEQFARLKIPVGDTVARLINLNQVMQRYGDVSYDDVRFLWIEDIIMANLPKLFPGMVVREAFPFRVLRDADIDYEYDDADSNEDVMDIIAQSVKERRFGNVVRVSVPTNISDKMMSYLLAGLEVRPDSVVYRIDGALGSAGLFELAGVDRPDLKFPPYTPRYPESISPDANIFEAIARGDILMHHPYDSFEPVVEFFRQAATDPAVMAIKATLYRTGKRSPIVEALMQARDNNKQVTVLVELKARFDEENNLEWARALEANGVHVVYGVEELPIKTHAKVALVVRREPNGVRRYLHLATGNYNASTARLYTDLGLFTCHPEMTDDAGRLFNRLTGFAPTTAYKRLLIAPEHLLPDFIALIDHEIAAARAGNPARIIFKMNQLEEDAVINKLYEASIAGVQIDLIVRGLCCLRPGLPGVSENIRVRSIVGRYLEHSRIYYFHNAPTDKQLYCGSADLMRRNLYNRVEVLFPVIEPRQKIRLLRVLATNLMDNQGAWEMQPEGHYMKVQAQHSDAHIESQSVFMRRSFGLDVLP